MRKGSVAAGVVALLFGGSMVAAACAPIGTPPSTTHFINPCATQAGITCDSVTGHMASRPTGAATLNKLAIVFNGSGAQPLGYSKLQSTLAAAGFHVIGLRYASSTGTGAACPQANALADPDCHRSFRSELTFGEGVNDPSGTPYNSPAVSIDLKNSVSNRLYQLVQALIGSYPTEGWEQYQQRTGPVCNTVNTTYGACELDWSKVVVVGHSLGAGEALYLSKFRNAARVSMVSGPFDEYNDGVTITVAPWIAEGGFATSPSKMFGLTHLGENNYAAQSAAWTTLGMAVPQVSVDSNLPPYGASQQLTTNQTPACLTDPTPKHNSTGQDLCVPGPPYLATAWKFMAGA